MRVYAALAFAAVAVLLAGTGGMILFGPSGDDRFAPCRQTRIASGSMSVGGPFSLVRHDGVRVSDSEVFTRPSLVYFGYTWCPDICPLDTARNVEAVDILDQSGVKVSPVFVTIDPARDTPDVLSDYAEAMHPEMIALTGSEEEIDQASKAYRVFYRRHDKEPDGSYLVDHSTFTYLVLPREGFVEFFRRDVSPEVLAERVSCFLKV